MADFNPEQYKSITRDQWNKSGGGYHSWSESIRQLLQSSIDRMIPLAGITEGSRILELATGGGVVTLQVARKAGPNGSVLATDLAGEFLELAKNSVKAEGLENVEFREMDGEVVDVPEGTFDVVFSSLGLMFFPDPLKSLKAQRLSIKSGGKVAAIVFSSPEKNPFFSIPVSIIRKRAGLPAPQPGQPGPFALGAPGLIESLFEKAELKDVKRETFSQQIVLPSTAEFIRFLTDAFGALHMMMAKMSDEEKAATWDDVTEGLRQFEGPDGFSCPLETHLCVGTR